MRFKVLSALVALTILGATAAADTRSDFSRGYDFTKLGNWQFAPQTQNPKDQAAFNSIWNDNIRQALEQRLAKGGFPMATSGEPNFLVAYHLSAGRGYEGYYGYPWAWRPWGFYGWRGWGPGWAGPGVWAVPYNRSTMVVDIIDAKSNQLVWRGFDSRGMDFNNSEKAISQSVDKLVKRFSHDIDESRKEQAKVK
jgi:hypothetical protein